MQLDIYENYNKMLRVLHSEAANARKTELNERLQEVAAEKTKYLNHEEGESLSVDDMQDVYCQVKGEQREKHKFSLATKGKNGDIADYLETRRPFGAANWSHRSYAYIFKTINFI